MTDLPNGIRQERDPNASLLSWVQQQLDMDILKGKQQKVNALEINPNQYDTSQLNLNKVFRPKVLHLNHKNKHLLLTHYVIL